MKKYAFLALAIAPAIVYPMNVDASTNTYIVKSGDTLSKIAVQYKLTVDQLKKMNNLTSDRIYAGQRLIISEVVEKQKGKLVASTKKSSTPIPPSNSSIVQEDKEDLSQSTYVVVGGDTLSKIANKYGVSVANLKAWNNLTSDLIFVGQKLAIRVGEVSEIEADVQFSDTIVQAKNRQIAEQLAKEVAIVSTPNADGLALYEKVLSLGNSFIGVPYLLGGNTPAGFDCSGYIHYVYGNSGMSILRKSSLDYFLYDTTMVEEPIPGDVVFFKNTYMAGISHMGIYLGGDQFIHAGSRGIEVSKLLYDYWKERFVAFKRFNGLK